MLDAILERVAEAERFNANAEVGPAAVLWPDENGQWESVVERIRKTRKVVTLGKLDPNLARGPAVWIRCVVAGTIDPGLPDGIPIVYMPGVARRDLRAVDSCPAELAPIAELQYRSQWFTHPNGKDWTLRSFLTNTEKGLGVKMADDAETADLAKAALGLLLDRDLRWTEGQFLDTEFFQSLLNPDPVRNLLDYVNDPQGFRSRTQPASWKAFVQTCNTEYEFNPEADSEIDAARAMGERNGAWSSVWDRFAETPRLFPGIPERLRQARPLELQFEFSGSWPQENEEHEVALRTALHELTSLGPEAARSEILSLEAAHAPRRQTVWAELDQAPLAFALEQLVNVVGTVGRPLSTNSLADMVAGYTEGGWRADDSAIESLVAAANDSDRAAVVAALSVIYTPWLDSLAHEMQVLAGAGSGSNGYSSQSSPSTVDGTAILFVDGLRFDLGKRLVRRLEGAGFRTALEPALAALPTVTETAKPAVMPLPEASLGPGQEFATVSTATGSKATIQVLRKLMTEYGIDVLGEAETGPSSATSWSECGDIDAQAHHFGVRLVDHIDDEIERIEARVKQLIDVGWSHVQVVTDHGWLLIPEGMKKTELPTATTEKKKGRCARVKPGAHIEVPTVPWRWDQHLGIAVAPGVTCFEAGKVYEHGGVSLQECVVPRISVAPGPTRQSKEVPEIRSVKWLGFLCRVELVGGRAGASIDLRLRPGDATSSIVERSKETVTADKTTLIVPDESYEQKAAYLVIVDGDGSILAQREVVVAQNR